MKFNKVTNFIPPNVRRPHFSILSIRGGPLEKKTKEFLKDLLEEMKNYPNNRHEAGVSNILWLKAIKEELNWRKKYEI